eukprot:7286721-Karenia_brevis.AAC.1
MSQHNSRAESATGVAQTNTSTNASGTQRNGFATPATPKCPTLLCPTTERSECATAVTQTRVRTSKHDHTIFAM